MSRQVSATLPCHTPHHAVFMLLHSLLAMEFAKEQEGPLALAKVFD